MHVLVTGGAGYIGSVLAPKLLARGHTVRVLDRLFWGVPAFAGAPGVEVVNADVRRMPAGVLDGIDAVVHLAGFSNDPMSDYNPAANWEMNVTATETLARLCLRQGVRRFVFGSSCSVYDGSVAAGELADESASVAPRGAYATSKYAAERILLEAAGAGLEPVLLRQATVFGCSPRMRFDLMVNSFVKDALLCGRLFVHGGGWMRRPLVSVGDLADVHVACLEAPRAAVAGEIFNVVQGNYRVRDVAEQVAALLAGAGLPVELLDAPVPPIVRDYGSAGDKLRKRLPVRLTVSPREGVAELIVAHRTFRTEQLVHPRYYNISWMELLEAVRPAFEAALNIFEPMPPLDFDALATAGQPIGAPAAAGPFSSAGGSPAMAMSARLPEQSAFAVLAAAGVPSTAVAPDAGREAGPPG
ncbi:MAG: NAD(P)-dependent oxidoreductase [Dehalococcoidia bacterium]